MSTHPITPAGVELVRKRLEHLKSVERPQNVRDIEEARAHGDLKENAEYHAAKERQGQIAAMISHYEGILGSAQVIDPTKLSGDRVKFGATVTLINLDDEDAAPLRYQIVGEAESDLEAGRISFASPLARALMGKAVDDEVVVRTPNGTRNVLIEEVEFK
jgi:transcription elongation factor GreA